MELLYEQSKKKNKEDYKERRRRREKKKKKIFNSKECATIERPLLNDLEIRPLEGEGVLALVQLVGAEDVLHPLLLLSLVPQVLRYVVF